MKFVFNFFLIYFLLFYQNLNLANSCSNETLQKEACRSLEEKKETLLYEIRKQRQISYSFIVRRSHILENSYEILKNVNKGPLRIYASLVFADEVHGGRGVYFDWFTQLSKEIFNPSNGFFKYYSEDNYLIEINPECSKMSYYKFFGLIVAMAISDGISFDVSFTRSFFKAILGESVELVDVEMIDPVFYKSLIWILNNDVSNEGYKFDMDEEVSDGKKYNAVALKYFGKWRKVTNENKKEYVDLMIHRKFTKRVEKQMTSFLEGFRTIIPFNLITDFTILELELLLCGLPKIDVNDWRQNTAYIGFTEDSKVIKWFWQIVESFDDEKRAMLLRFVSGASRVPSGGFEEFTLNNRKFTIIFISPRNMNSLPMTGTCFNSLRLPNYPDKKTLEDKLTIAIKETAFCL